MSCAELSATSAARTGSIRTIFEGVHVIGHYTSTIYVLEHIYHSRTLTINSSNEALTMEGNPVLYPMFFMVLELAMTVVMIVAALRAVNGGLNPEHFRYSRGFKVPDYMQSAYHHYSNLFEMPYFFMWLRL